MERACIDTNVLLRFLTGDPPSLAQQAQTLFAAVDAGHLDLVLEEIVVAEAVWVLESFYGQRPAAISATLLEVLAHPGIVCRDKARLARALVLYADRGVDFADALLAVSVQDSENKVVYSFDRHFDSVEGVIRRIPGRPAEVAPQGE